MRFHARGFTLIELMIVITVLAAILAMAAPSFTQIVENVRVSTQTNDFVSAVNSARAEAIRIGGSVWLTAKNGNFSDGWCVRTSNDECGTSDPPDLLDHPPLDNRINLAYASGQETTSFAFNRLGALVTPGDAATIDLAPPNCGAGRTKRRIDINAAGRISVQRPECP